jgi:hypothetical protein
MSDVVQNEKIHVALVPEGSRPSLLMAATLQ